MNESKIKKFNIVVKRTFVYPMEVEALTKKEAMEIAKGHKLKKEFWVLDETDYQHEEKYRSNQQNKALHLYCSQISKALNEDGITMVETLDKFNQFDIFPTMESIKEVWKNIQFSLFGFRSTRRLKKDEQIDKIYDPMNKVLSENYQIHIPFPDRKTLDYTNMSIQYDHRNG